MKISYNFLLDNVYPFKMDAKCRVSLPAEWRKVIGDNPIRLMHTTCYQVPVIKILTEDAVVALLKEIASNDLMKEAEKRQLRAYLASETLQTLITAQGKLFIPKRWCEHPEIKPNSQVMLKGEDKHAIICAAHNYERLQRAEKAWVQEKNQQMDFF